MSWKFTDTEIAYQFSNGVLRTCIDVYYTGNEIKVHEGNEESFFINQDGTIEIGEYGFNELSQFNCCYSLLSMIHLLNEIVSKNTPQPFIEIDLVDILQEPPIFAINRLTYDQLELTSGGLEEVDLGFELRIGNDLYSGTKGFTDYSFIKGIEQRKWTISELANFAVHFQKFLVEAEEGAEKDVFLQIDDEVLNLLKEQR